MILEHTTRFEKKAAPLFLHYKLLRQVEAQFPSAAMLISLTPGFNDFENAAIQNILIEAFDGLKIEENAPRVFYRASKVALRTESLVGVEHLIVNPKLAGQLKFTFNFFKKGRKNPFHQLIYWFDAAKKNSFSQTNQSGRP